MSKTSDDFMKHTKARIKQLKSLQKKIHGDDRALVIQQLEYLIQTFKESK